MTQNQTNRKSAAIKRRQANQTAILFLCFSVLVPSLARTAEKMTAQEVVRRHLSSIGSPEARMRLQSRILKGQGFLHILQGGSGRLPAVVTHLSEGPKNGLLFEVDNPRYFGEQILFNGEDVWVTPAFQGQRRSGLGEFIYTHDQILKGGLLGGTIATGWALLSEDSMEADVRYRGLKKEEGRKLHRLGYRPKKRRGDLQIDFYFDAGTFRHVQTTYRLTIPARMGASAVESAGEQPTHLLVEEHFDNFQELDGLILPARWRIRFSRTGLSPLVWEWEIIFQDLTQNEPIAPASFRPR